MTNSAQLPFFASCPARLEKTLYRELQQMGAEQLKTQTGGVTFNGDLTLAYRACLWSRIANRVLLPLVQFPAGDEQQLYDEVRKIPWPEHFTADESLRVDFFSSRSNITHSHYGAQKVKDAIVDEFREHCQERPSVDKHNPDITINVYVLKNAATLSLDLSGGSLHQRNYRPLSKGKRVHQAPLKENLAAALLILSNWQKIAASGGTLVDPMCGSGTLLIEAAMIAGDIAPGLSRPHFGFLKWRQHQAQDWQTLLDEAKQRRAAHAGKIPCLLGFDISRHNLQTAREHIKNAGLEAYIQLKQGDATDFKIPAKLPPGLIIANPPYGERLGESDELQHVYYQLGKHIKKNYPQWQFALFTGNSKLSKSVPMRSQKTFKLFNGKLDCELLLYQSQDTTTTTPPQEQTPAENKTSTEDAWQQATPKFKFREQADSETAEEARMFANRLRKNLRHLKKWARRQGIDCYRIYDADLPEYSLAVDLYFADQLYVHVQEYAAPFHIAEQKVQQRRRLALQTLPEVLEINPEQVFYKVREKQKGTQQYQKQASSGHFFEVQEGGLRFRVNLADYLDTGLFLDHRLTREMVRDKARNKRFLNLFCYTASVSVYAIAGGAGSSVAVDMSNTYIEWAHQNYQLNGIEGEQHQLVQADCLQWLAKCRDQFDLIFVDPPTFSNSKRMEGEFDIQRDQLKLLEACKRLLAPKGEIIFSNNYRKFKLDKRLENKFIIMDISSKTLPEDFSRNPKIHSCWTLTPR